MLVGRGPHTVDLDPELLIVRGASMHGSIGHSGTGTFGHVIDLMAAGRVDMTRIVSATVDLAGAARLLDGTPRARPARSCHPRRRRDRRAGSPVITVSISGLGAIDVVWTAGVVVLGPGVAFAVLAIVATGILNVAGVGALGLWAGDEMLTETARHRQAAYAFIVLGWPALLPIAVAIVVAGIAVVLR